jgi:hypothetical protein
MAFVPGFYGRCKYYFFGANPPWWGRRLPVTGNDGFGVLDHGEDDGENFSSIGLREVLHFYTLT